MIKVFLASAAGFLMGAAAFADDDPAEAKTEAEMKPYTEPIRNTEVKFQMVPIPGGEFVMGSPDGEADRGPDEGPQHKVKIEPFWMGKHEVTWDEYDIWSFDLDIKIREFKGVQPTELDKAADIITRPTKPYTPMDFEMGRKGGYPAICMTQHAAKRYCEWLSAKTGHYYRLPTEAEWEYACRAGTTTAYSFGDDPAELGDYAWYFDNSNEKYQKIGKKKPNPWGLYDIHGNVAEWVLDKYEADFYAKSMAKNGEGVPMNPVCIPDTEYPRVVRGGGWDSDAKDCRSAARLHSSEDWKQQDPQLPQSAWYFTDARWVGFRLVRPLKVPAEEEREKRHYNAIVPSDVKEKIGRNR
jgi:formylglycine-generating enzyme required for sulfatase activity